MRSSGPAVVSQHGPVLLRHPDPAQPRVPEAKSPQVQLPGTADGNFQASVGSRSADGPRVTLAVDPGQHLGRNLPSRRSAKPTSPYPLPRPGSAEGSTDVASAETRYVFPRGSRSSGPHLVSRAATARAHRPRARGHRPDPRAYAQDVFDLTNIGTGRSRPDPARTRHRGVAYEVGYQELTLARAVDRRRAPRNRPGGTLRLPPGRMLFGSLRPVPVVPIFGDDDRPRSVPLFHDPATISDLRGSEDRRSDGSTFKLAQAAGPRRRLSPAAGALSFVVLGRRCRVVQLDGPIPTPGTAVRIWVAPTSLRGFHEEGLQPQTSRPASQQVRPA